MNDSFVTSFTNFLCSSVFPGAWISQGPRSRTNRDICVVTRDYLGPDPTAEALGFGRNRSVGVRFWHV